MGLASYLFRVCESNQSREIKPYQNRNPRSCPALLVRAIWKESFMGSTTDKIKGNANEAIGKAKQGIGEATGSDRLKGEGVVQEVKGKGQKTVGDAKQATKDAVNSAAATTNKNL